MAAICKARFTSALRQPCNCLRQQISGFRAAASRCCEQRRKTAIRKKRSQGYCNVKNTIFDMFIFFAIFVRFLEDARRLQDMQGVRTTDVIVRHQRICLTKAARLLPDNRAFYCKAAARMLRNLRLQLKIAQWPHGCSAGTVRRIALSCNRLANFAGLSCGSLACDVR